MKNPPGSAVFLFCNRQTRILTVLYWDQIDFALWQMKLKHALFPSPESGEAVRESTADQLRMLLSRCDVWRADRLLHY